MSKKPYPSETADRFIVRLPEGMRDRLKEEAAKNGRSMNAEIVHHLQSAMDFVDRVPRGGIPVDHEQLQAIVKAAEELTRLIQSAEDKHAAEK